MLGASFRASLGALLPVLGMALPSEAISLAFPALGVQSLVAVRSKIQRRGSCHLQTIVQKQFTALWLLNIAPCNERYFSVVNLFWPHLSLLGGSECLTSTCVVLVCSSAEKGEVWGQQVTALCS